MQTKNIFILTFMLLISLIGISQDNKNNFLLHQGNKLYKNKNYSGAEEYYKKAIEQGATDNATHFNLGDSYYRQGKFDEAAKKFEEIATSSIDKKDKSKAYHNLGNSWMEKKDYQKSIEAYKNALKNNPNDEETRYNLAYAQKKLDQQNKNNQNKDKNKDNNKDPNKDKDKDSDKNNDKNDKDKDKDKDKNENDQEKDKDEQGDQKKNEPQGGIDKKQAEKILNAQNNREKELQKMQQEKKAKMSTGSKPEKDW